MSEKVSSPIFLKAPSEKYKKSEKSKNIKKIFANKLINEKEFKKKEIEDNFNFDYSNDLLNENIKLSPMVNPIPCFTVKSESSSKEVSTRVTFYSKNSKNININISTDNNKKEEDNKKNKTKILNKNLKKARLNLISNNKCFRRYSPIFDKNQKIFKSQNPELTSFNITETNNNKNNTYEIFINKKKKLINNINKKNLLNNNNIPTTTKHKFINHLFFSSDHFYESKLQEESIDKKIDKLEKKQERKNRIMKILGQRINVLNMKIEILQNFKKNKNLNSIKKQIEYNKIFCNNDLKRLKDNYYKNITKHMNHMKYLEIKLIKCKEDYIPMNKHKDIIKKEELLFKIKKVELIEKILHLKKKVNELISRDLTTHETFNLDDTFEEQTIKNVSFNDYSILKDTIGGKLKYGDKKKFNDEIFSENKIIKINPHQINFFKAKFINK